MAIYRSYHIDFGEERWCNIQKLTEKFIDIVHQYSIRQADVIRCGTQITVVSFGHLSVMSLNRDKFIRSCGINTELINDKSLTPSGTTIIANTIKKTGKLWVIDSGSKKVPYAPKIISQILELSFYYFTINPQIILIRDILEQICLVVTKYFKYNTENIAYQVIRI